MNNFFIQIFIITALLTIWGAAFGLLMSKISKSISVVYLSIPLVIVINMLFSGVLIKFDNFNPKFNRKSVPDLAMIVPTYHGINTLITEMYLYDDKKSNIVKQKEMLYEASYYLDYFTPELHNLMKKDSLRTMKIIESECKKNQFFPKIQNQSLDSYLIKIKSYYSNQYNHSLAWLSKKDINQGNTNQSIKFLVNSYYQDRLVIKSNEFLRRFLVPYIPAYYKQENSFFGAYYKVFGFAFDNYTFAIISISLSILFTSLLMLLIKKPLI